MLNCWQSPVLRFVLRAGLLFNLLLGCQLAYADNACELQMHRASTKYNIPIGILYAVGLTETGGKNSLQPYALNIEGRAVLCRRPVPQPPGFGRRRLKGPG